MVLVEVAARGYRLETVAQRAPLLRLDLYRNDPLIGVVGHDEKHFIADLVDVEFFDEWAAVADAWHGRGKLAGKGLELPGSQSALTAPIGSAPT